MGEGVRGVYMCVGGRRESVEEERVWVGRQDCTCVGRRE